MASAWVRTTEDPFVGPEQKCEQFYTRILGDILQPETSNNRAKKTRIDQIAREMHFESMRQVPRLCGCSIMHVYVHPNPQVLLIMTSLKWRPLYTITSLSRPSLTSA